jgi:hypothetical protein
VNDWLVGTIGRYAAVITKSSLPEGIPRLKHSVVVRRPLNIRPSVDRRYESNDDGQTNPDRKESP